MTLREAYAYGQEQLKKAEVDEATLDAWYLLEYVTGVTRAEYFLDMGRVLCSEEELRYCESIELRSKHIPLQHITGVQEFMGLEFCVNEHVLVPRQDTEILVETVLDSLNEGADVLDMCTGSGCILISLLKLGASIRGTGVDISEQALEVAKRNAKKHDVCAEFIQGDLFDNVEGQYDVIVSNPPYIPTAVIDGLRDEVKLHDPYIALNGEEDGLEFYRRIVKESGAHLKAGGSLYFEIGHDQAEAVSEFMEAAGYKKITVKKDLAGLDRVVFGVYI